MFIKLIKDYILDDFTTQVVKCKILKKNRSDSRQKINRYLIEY